MKKIILKMALPFLKAIGQQLQEIDDNSDGTDDLAGAAIVYSAEVTQAVLDKRAIPFPPEILLRAGKPVSPAAIPDPED
jgi:hypothetical protein